MSIFIQKTAPSRLPRILWVLSLCAATLAILAAPAAADDEARIVAEAKRIHKNVLVLDSHVDIPVDYGLGKLDPGIDGATQVDLPKLERGGVDAAVFAVFARPGWRSSEGVAKARDEANRKLRAIREIPQALSVPRSARPLRRRRRADPPRRQGCRDRRVPERSAAGQGSVAH